MDTTIPAFNWEATLSQGNKVIESHFTPWVEANGARYIDLPGSDLDRKFGIDGIVINLENGKSRTVQVKQDSRISETGNIYLEVTKVLGSNHKKVIAQQIYYIDTKANKMYSMRTAELQAEWDNLTAGLKPKTVTTKTNAGNVWNKSGYAVPLSRFHECVKSFREIKL